MCGTPLAAAPPVVRSPTERPSSAPGRQGLIVAGLGILAVVALYGATLLSDRSEAVTPAEDVATVGTASPIPDVVPALPDSLQAAADAFASQNSASGWFESGRYYLTAAFNATQTDPTASVQWARRAIADFDKSLAIEEDPQVRVALAEAATFDPADPMRSVQELRAVLAADPDNVDALVLLAERRLMIGRTDSARVGFERVLALAPEGSLAKQRAQQGLDAVGQAGG